MNRRGVAQILVLWVLLLLFVLSAAFSRSTRLHAASSRGRLDSVRAYYQARAGVERAVASMAAIPLDNLVNSPMTGGTDEGDSYEATVLPESGKLDINIASEPLIESVLSRSEVPGLDAERVAGSIAKLKARSGRLGSLAEVMQAEGVTGRVYRDVIEKVFTVHGGSSQVNVNAATKECLTMLPGVGEALAEEIVARRSDRMFSGQQDLVAFLSSKGIQGQAWGILTTTDLSTGVTVLSVGRSGAARRAVSCVVERTAPGPMLPKILSWTDFAEPG